VGTTLISRGHRAWPTWCSDARRWPGPTSAGSALWGAERGVRRRHVLPAVPGGAGEARPGVLGVQLLPGSTPTSACGASTSAACPPRPTRCWRSAVRRSTVWSRAGLTDARTGPRQGPGARLDRAQPGGPVLADEPALGKSELVYPRLEPVDESAQTRSMPSATTTSAPSPPKSSPAPRPWPSSARSTTTSALPGLNSAHRGPDSVGHDEQTYPGGSHWPRVGVARRAGTDGVTRWSGPFPRRRTLRSSPRSTQGDAARRADTGCDVVVDFTHPGVVMSNLHWCVRQ